MRLELDSNSVNYSTDCRGLVLLAAHKTLHCCGSAVQTEALAYLEGIKMAAEWIHMPIWVETDNVEVARALQQPNRLRSSWAPIIEEVKSVFHRVQDVQVQGSSYASSNGNEL